MSIHHGDDTRPDEKETRPGRLSRRRFLGALGAVGAAAAGMNVATLSPRSQSVEASAPGESPAAERQWVMVIDLRRCDGCEKCADACKKTHYLGEDQNWIKVYQRANAAGEEYYMPRLCMHCANPPCVRVCPVGATFKNAEGVVLVDQNKCIGCRTCMAACPYEARYFNWQEPPSAPSVLPQPMPEFPVPQQKGTVGKCILCVHNIEMGKLPACVEACTMEALYIGDLDADVGTNGAETVKLSKFLRENDAVRFREELGTEPRVYYISGHGQDLDF